MGLWVFDVRVCEMCACVRCGTSNALNRFLPQAKCPVWNHSTISMVCVSNLQLKMSYKQLLWIQLNISNTIQYPLYITIMKQRYMNLKRTFLECLRIEMISESLVHCKLRFCIVDRNENISKIYARYLWAINEEFKWIFWATHCQYPLYHCKNNDFIEATLKTGMMYEVLRPCFGTPSHLNGLTKSTHKRV